MTATGAPPADRTRTTDRPSGSRRGPAPRTVLAVASLGAMVAFIDATIVNIAFPDIARSFPGTSISTLSWVLNAYNIVFAAFLVAAGRLADLLGRRRMFIAGLEIFTAASLLCAVAPSPTALIGFRVLQALGAALLVPCSLALVLNAFPVEQRTHGVALLSAVAAASAGLGPSLGGLLVSAADWRLVFLVNIPIGLVAVILSRRLLVESRAPGRRRLPDLAGAGLFALAIAALVLAVVKGQAWGWTGLPTLISFLAAVVLGAVFLWRCRWHSAPIIDLQLLRLRTFSAANAMTIVAAAGFYGYTLTNVLFLTGIWRYSVLQAGLAMTPGPFVAAAVAGPTSRLMQRLGPRPVLVAGGLIWGGAVLWFVEVIGARPDFLGQWLPGILLLGVGAGTLLPNLSGVAVASAPGESFATATGLNSVSRQVGAALGVALVVAIIGTPSSLDAAAAFRHAWTFGSACLFAAGLGCLLVSRIDPERAPALADAARLVLGPRAPERLAPAPARAHRAIGPAVPPATAASQSAADFLALVPTFAELDRASLATLAAGAGAHRVEAGAWLFHQGDTADAMHVIRAGRLEVVDEASGTVIRVLGRGDVVGELALIAEATRSAGVRAARTADLLTISESAFVTALERSPQLAIGLCRALGGLLRQSRAAPPTRRARPTTVALVGLDPELPIAALAAELRGELGALLDAALLTRPDRDAGSSATAADRFAPRLDRAEAAHDLVLLDAGRLDRAEPWSEFCLQQADRILAVTTGGGARGPAPIGRGELRGCDLVAYDVRPGSGALAAVAAELAPAETHVVRPDSLVEDLARLARRLAGRSLGIVLSGGGARAFAHIGVLEELTAAGLVIDRVLGVSMGAYVGGLFASGLDPEGIDARCFEEWVQRRPLGDFTVPRHGLIRGERVKAMLHRSFGALALEELPRSFMCGYTELRSGRLVVARTGPLWEQVGFSINIPVLGAPQVRGRDLFIDGSLVDNLPVRVMSDLNEGPVIAVDVKATFDRPGPAAPGARPEPAASGSSRDPTTPPGQPGPPCEPRPPLLGETLARVLLLGSANTSDAARSHADLIIKPRAEGVGLLEFHQLDAAREAGRRAAHEALEALEARPPS